VTVRPGEAAYPLSNSFNVEHLLLAIGDNVDGRGWGGIFYKHSDGTEGHDDWSYWNKKHTITVTVPSGASAHEPFEDQLRPVNDYAVSDSTWTISLSSPTMMGLMGVIAVVLTLNIIFMCYLNCCKGNRSHRYKPVHVNDSGFESEANAINVASE